MKRTTKHKVADENLSKAIDEAMEAYGYTEPGALTAGYLVLVEQRIWRGTDGDGEAGHSALLMFYKDGDMPWIPILGLLRAATLKSEKQFNTPEDEE